MNFITIDKHGRIDGPKPRPRMLGKVSDFHRLSTEQAIDYGWIPCEIQGETYNPDFELRHNPVFSEKEDGTYKVTYSSETLPISKIKKNLLDRVNREYFSASMRSWQIPHSTERLQQRPQDVSNWNSLAAYVAGLDDNDTIRIRAESNNDVVMTAFNTKVLMSMMFEDRMAMLQECWDKKNEIMACDTVEELKAIDLTGLFGGGL